MSEGYDVMASSGDTGDVMSSGADAGPMSTSQRGAIAVDQARVIAEVQGQIVMARKFPRNTAAAYARLIDACARPLVAKGALYSYPRGKDDSGKANIVKGPSIRLAEEAARAYGNIDTGWRIVSENKTEGWSDVEAYAWDLETNNKVRINFRVTHWRHTKTTRYKLTDERDIYELCANNASRRLRACILKVIPSDFIEGAVEQVAKTIARGDGQDPLSVTVNKLVAAFKQFGVNAEMIEARLGHKVDLTTPDELVDLRAIYTTLKDSEKKPHDFFAVPKDEEEGNGPSKADAINAQLVADGSPPPPAA